MTDNYTPCNTHVTYSWRGISQRNTVFVRSIDYLLFVGRISVAYCVSNIASDVVDDRGGGRAAD